MSSGNIIKLSITKKSLLLPWKKGIANGDDVVNTLFPLRIRLFLLRSRFFYISVFRAGDIKLSLILISAWKKVCFSSSLKPL